MEYIMDKDFTNSSLVSDRDHDPRVGARGRRTIEMENG